MFDKEDMKHPYPDDCMSVIEKFLTVCLPVKIKPCVHIGKVSMENCGKPIISNLKHDKCCSKANENGTCCFTIIQKMKVEIPLDFRAETDIDSLFVDCELRDDRDDCKD